MISTKYGTQRRTNVMTPLNWATAAFLPVVTAAGAWQHDNWYGITCICMAGFILLAYFGLYLFFAIREPDRLQSEECKLAQQELTLAANGKLEVTTQTPQAQIELGTESKTPE